MLEKIKIFAVDDHELFLFGLNSELTKDKKFEIIGTANNSKEALAFLKKHSVYIDVAILDINLKDEKETFYLIKKVVKNYPLINVVVISTYDGKVLIRQLKEIGVKAYLSKNENIDTIIKSIKDVVKGKLVFPICNEQTNLSNNFSLDAFEMKVQITVREKEVLQLISEGMDDSGIANELCISSKTVKTHRTNLRKKFNVKKTSELIALAIKFGVV